MTGTDLSRAQVGVKSWLDRPLSTFGCVTGWILATILFLGFTAWLGGPVEGDAPLSVFTTWAIAHGHIACAYSLSGVQNLPTLARPNAYLPPLYPLLSAGFLLLVHSTYNVPFPSAVQLGNHCMTADHAMFIWAIKANAIIPTIRIGYLSWFALMAGIVALLRAVGRGRNGWEPTTLLFLAVAAPVFECLTEYFHPEDILAMGLSLGSLAFALRGRWAWAGLLIGLAFTSNQFALLLAGPMLVIAPRENKFAFTRNAVVVVAVVSLPIVLLTSGNAFSPSILGTGFTPAYRGGTILSDTHLKGAILFIIARVSPLIIAMAVAWWAKRRFKDEVLQPIPFLSIIATALAIRLVFDFSVYGYFFIGIATMLVLVDVIVGRIRGQMLIWLALVTLIFDPIPWGFVSNSQTWGLGARLWLPNSFLVLAVAIILLDLFKHHIRWYVVCAGIFVGATLVKWPWNHEILRQPLPPWVIQLVLVPIAIWLAIEPLLNYGRSTRDSNLINGIASQRSLDF